MDRSNKIRDNIIFLFLILINICAHIFPYRTCNSVIPKTVLVDDLVTVRVAVLFNRCKNEYKSNIEQKKSSAASIRYMKNMCSNRKLKYLTKYIITSYKYEWKNYQILVCSILNQCMVSN